MTEGFDKNYIPTYIQRFITFKKKKSDTVTDGRLDLMSHVGVTIDLGNCEFNADFLTFLGFLLLAFCSRNYWS